MFRLAGTLAQPEQNIRGGLGRRAVRGQVRGRTIPQQGSNGKAEARALVAVP
jgi:hypothetical protein